MRLTFLLLFDSFFFRNSSKSTSQPKKRKFYKDLIKGDERATPFSYRRSRKKNRRKRTLFGASEVERITDALKVVQEENDELKEENKGLKADKKRLKNKLKAIEYYKKCFVVGPNRKDGNVKRHTLYRRVRKIYQLIDFLKIGQKGTLFCQRVVETNLFPKGP